MIIERGGRKFEIEGLRGNIQYGVIPKAMWTAVPGAFIRTPIEELKYQMQCMVVRRELAR
jgi:hypothetical protein